MPVTFPQRVMLARSAERLPGGRVPRGGCVYEPKWDGYRGLVLVTEAGVRVQSRRGADLALPATSGSCNVAGLPCAYRPAW